MRFIVDLYRYIIFGFCGLIIISASLALFTSFGRNGSSTGETPTVVLISVGAALAFLVLNLGGLAILVSLHDRHVEVVEQATRLADAMESLAVSRPDSFRPGTGN